MNILEVANLSVCFGKEKYKTCPVKNISFFLKKSSVLGIVGESGSGKSLTALSILGLLPYPKACEVYFRKAFFLPHKSGQRVQDAAAFALPWMTGKYHRCAF